MKPQCRDILRYMVERGPITQMDAINRLTDEYGDPAPCTRLAARISDLENLYGYRVEHQKVNGFAVYRLAPPVTTGVQQVAFPVPALVSPLRR